MTSVTVEADLDAGRGPGELLRSWRRRRRYSQLRLASAAGVSPRHLSFVETGRSRPSRELLASLARALDLPLRARNDLLLAAGFAPAYPPDDLSAAPLASARAAVQAYLDGCAPAPGLAFDRRGDIVMVNGCVQVLTDCIAPPLLEPPVNVHRVSLHPDGLARRVRNLPEFAAAMLAQLERQAADEPALDDVLVEVSGYPSVALARDAAPAGPIVPLELDHPAGHLRLLTALTVFGTARAVALAELTVEAFVPADEVSRDRLEALAAEAP